MSAHDPWRLVYEGFDPAQEPLREALCTLGNGYFETRGAAAESRADAVHYPGTYLAGGYNRLISYIRDRDVVNEDLVNLPNWLPLSFRLDEEPWFGMDELKITEFRQMLDLKRGTLSRSFSIEGMLDGSIRVSTERFVSMRDPHLAAIRWTIAADCPLDRLQFRSVLDGDVTNWGVARYRQLRGDHLAIQDTGNPQDRIIRLRARMKQAPLEISLSARHHILVDGEPVDGQGAAYEGKNSIEWLGPRISVDPGQSVSIEKVISLHTSRDPALGDLIQDGLKELDRAPEFDALLERHCQSWDGLWKQFDLRVDTAPSVELKPHGVQSILRLHTFHLLQVASPNTRALDTSVPARGWTGESYRGHIFWDEAYILPFYVTRSPDVARALLLYRYNRLDEARVAAAAEGYEGAMFPWQSGSSGREETQTIHLNPTSGKWDPDNSHLQRHVNCAIALDVWRYFETTGDLAFLEGYGAEMLVEIARFWASLCHWNPKRSRFEILGVMGPDEFHEGLPDVEDAGLRNNVYTNVMAVWCMKRAEDALQRIAAPTSERLQARLGITETERSRWDTISQAMYLPRMSNGLLEQFEGYEALEELDWDAYRAKYTNIGRMDRILRAEGDSPNRYRLSKQPDLCMLFYFLDMKELTELLQPLGYDLTADQVRDTILFYRERTSHGSTMSHLVFGAILDPYEPAIAWEHYVNALRSDVDDIQGGTTPEGIHAALMAGTVCHVIERMAGVSVREGALRIQPRLPEGVRRVECRYRVHGVALGLKITNEAVQVQVAEGEGMRLAVDVCGTRYFVGSGECLDVSLQQVK